jgi:hypothetical protein
MLVHGRLTSASKCYVRIGQSLTRAENLRTQMDGTLDNSASDLGEILKTMCDLGTEFKADAPENSVLTAHTNDGKSFEIDLDISIC